MISQKQRDAGQRDLTRMIKTGSIVALSALVLLTGCASVSAEELTFARDIAPIIATHCAACHRPGGAAPFSLITYPDVKGRARQVATALRRRTMPPWKPEPGYGRFAGERRLTDEQIGVFERWLDGGARAGDTTTLAPVTAADDDWQLGRPDVVVSLPVPYRLAADGRDRLRNFVLPIPVSARRYVKAWEFRTTNPQVVHHATMVIDPTRTSRRMDEQDPEPGYEGLVPMSAQNPAGYFLGWTPGQTPHAGDADMAWTLDGDSDLVVMAHLRPTDRVETVQLAVGLYFAATPPSRVPAMIRLNCQEIDIPAGERAYTVTDSYVLPADVDAYTIQPHAHMLAKQVKGIAELPDGTTRWLIYIREWDFHWQDAYRYVSPVALPAGTRLRMEYTYDNSDDNPLNSNHPPRRISYGQRTSDEMGELWIQVIPRRRDDLGVLTRTLAAKLLPQNISGYEMMIRTDPDNPALHDDLALLYAQAGDLQKTVDHFGESLRLRPHAPAAHYNVGNALIPLRRLEEAERQFRIAVELDPEYPPGHFGLGLVLQAQDRLDEAIASYTRALRLRPEWPEARAKLAEALSRSRARTRR
jgi:hypothetical protein